MKPTRRALLCLLASYGVWAVLAAHIGATRAALYDYTDHWSHYGNAALFLRHGFDLYRFPASRYCANPSPAAARGLPDEPGCAWCVAAGAATDERPLCINWQGTRHGYPPGLLLYSLPEVLLFDFSSLSLRAINVFTILKYLIAAHLLIWLLWKLVFEAPAAERAEPGEGWLRYGLFGLFYLEVLKWTLSGFYDPIAVCAIFVAVWQLRRGRGTDAILALSVALFLHFRALWYLPLFFTAGWTALRNREWNAGRARALAKLAASALLLGVSLYAFALLYPGLEALPHNSGVMWKDLSLTTAASWNLALPLLPVLLYLAWGRQWTLLGCVVWQLFMITRTYQVQGWHILFLLPLFGLARLEGKRASLVAAAVVYLTEALVIFYNAAPIFNYAAPIPGGHLVNLMQLWQPWWRW
ncbi:MAG: hypothetical protein ACYDCL_22105 [Myxococcales bacterium]